MQIVMNTSVRGAGESPADSKRKRCHCGAYPVRRTDGKIVAFSHHPTCPLVSRYRRNVSKVGKRRWAWL